MGEQNDRIPGREEETGQEERPGREEEKTPGRNPAQNDAQAKRNAGEEKVSASPRTPDLFDKLFTLPGLRWAAPFFARYREVLLYLFFGAVTTFVSFAVFWLFHEKIGWNEHPANLVAWVSAVLVAFFTNRAWVFSAGREVRGRSFFLQIGEFYLSRVASFGVEEAIIAVFVTWLGLSAMWVKAVASVVVVLLNYILSKFIVFRKKSKNENKT